MLGEVERLRELSKKASEPMDSWDGMLIDPEEEFIWVPECSYLAGTMIALADTYEGSGNDCAFIAEAIRFIRSAAFEEMVRDAGRLDWLLTNCATVRTDGEGNWFVYFDWLPAGSDQGPNAPSRRAAIDTAMSADGAKGE